MMIHPCIKKKKERNTMPLSLSLSLSRDKGDPDQSVYPVVSCDDEP